MLGHNKRDWGNQMRAKWYVGVYGSGRMAFRAAGEVTQETHGTAYYAVIGPFRTMRGARYMAKFGHNNPHLPDVAAAERWAKLKVVSR